MKLLEVHERREGGSRKREFGKTKEPLARVRGEKTWHDKIKDEGERPGKKVESQKAGEQRKAPLSANCK